MAIKFDQVSTQKCNKHAKCVAYRKDTDFGKAILHSVGIKAHYFIAELRVTLLRIRVVANAVSLSQLLSAPHLSTHLRHCSSHCAYTISNLGDISPSNAVFLVWRWHIGEKLVEIPRRAAHSTIKVMQRIAVFCRI